MAEITLAAETRTEFGKGAARRLRRAQMVPAVLYGHGAPPAHITLKGHDTMLALRNSNALLDIQVEGNSQLALPKQVQRNVITGFIEHVDLVMVRRGEKVTVDVPVTLTGEAAPETIINLEYQVLTVLALATNIPEQIEISVEGLQVGDHILLGAVELPEGVELDGNPEALAVGVSAAPTQDEMDADLTREEEGDEFGADEDDEGDSESDDE